MLALLWQPFVEYAFLRRALVGGALLAASSAPLGVFLMLRRMSLIGDAIAHGILPGAALGFWLAGLSLPAMAVGGLGAGLALATGAAWVSRRTGLREDASLAALYPVALASGVLLLGLAGRRVDLLGLLFGSALAVDAHTLALMAGVALGTLGVLALLFRALVQDSLDPVFLRSQSRVGPLVHGAFLGLVVLNLVVGFQAIGALMMVGLMILPAVAARFWSQRLPVLIGVAALLGVTAVWLGLLLSYHAGLPSGPAIIVVAGAGYGLSLAFGPVNGLLRRQPLSLSP